MVPALFRKLSYRLPLRAYPYKSYMHRHQCIFIHIPKNAGTSVLHALGDTGGRFHEPFSLYEKVNPYHFHRYTKFAIIRSPETRLCSAYHYLCRGGNQKQEDREFARILAPFSDVNDFILSRLDAAFMFRHPLLFPQSYYVCDRLGNIKVERLLRFEHLHQDWLRFVQDLARPLPGLPKLNTSSSSAQGSLSLDAKLKLKALYADDYALLKQRP